ncbi:hypothetical protein Nepgr_019140 [Nepenthes gracilis]|uniref:Glycosyltransferase n=1 Tax=Nepenthes gracilis TaxID=150966 RepID=A0AAD3SVB2_NEPGR|nr:hypothetical protein Nepgr_019140 [Nepenthes gracilis]
MEHHVAMLPSPGIGHLISLVEIAKLLVSRHDFSVTVLVPTIGEPTKSQKSFLQNLPPKIDYILLPPVIFDDLPEDAAPELKICLTVTRSISPIRDALDSLKARTQVVAFLTDLFGSDAFDIAKELGIPHYLYFPSTPISLLLLYHLPKLDETTTCQYKDLPEPVKLPGCPPLPGKDFLQPVQDRHHPAYKLVLHHAKRCTLGLGTLINCAVELDPPAVQALQEYPGCPPVYPIGPIIHEGSDGSEIGSECLRWLDDQPSGSVLYVAFGSGGTLSSEQLNELALGLELSGQRFLWVVKSPNNNSTSGAYFSTQSKEDPLAFMPEGFLERTKDRGLVVPSWAPQIQILKHSSTGGFLSHCGWGSTLESVLHGVPMIAWPLYAEQPMNAVMLHMGWKAALRPNANEKGLVERGEVSHVVKELMEGEEGKRIRQRMKDLGEAAKTALTENGSSSKYLSQLALRWKNQDN